MAHVPHPQRFSEQYRARRQARQLRTQGAASHLAHTSLASDREDEAKAFNLGMDTPLSWSQIDPVTGEVVAALGEDGSLASRTIIAGESLTYRGDELADALDSMPRLVARVQDIDSSGTRPTSSSVHHQSAMRIDWQAYPGKLYIVRADGLTAASAGVDTRARWRLNLETGGGYATVQSGTVAEGVSGPRPSSDTQLPPVSLVRQIPNNTERFMSCLVSYSAWGGTDDVNLSLNGTSPATMEVYEYPNIPTSGFTGYLGTSGPDTGDDTPDVDAPVRKVETWTAVDTAYWRNGSRTTRQLVQGYTAYDPSGGTKEGLAVFGAGNRYGQTMATTLAGATVEKIEVYVYFDHWHSAAGGTAGIALHGSHGNLPGQSTLGGVIQTRNMARGEGKWIPLSSAYFAGFKSGAYRGFGVKAPSTSSQYYGTAHGGLGSWKTPKIRVTYLD